MSFELPIVPARDAGWERAARWAVTLSWISLLYMGVEGGVGVWQGAIEHRTTEPLVPDLTSWPRPSRYASSRPRNSDGPTGTSCLQNSVHAPQPVQP